MNQKDFKAFLNRCKWNKQTSDDEKILNGFINENTTSTSGKTFYEVAQMYVNHQEKEAKISKQAKKQSKEEQLDMFTNQGLMFPLVESDSAMPKQILRGTMFAPIKRGKRQYLNNKLVAKTKDDDDIIYTGAQLDQADLDVLLAVMQLLSEFTTSKNVTKVVDITNDENGKIEYSRLYCSANGLLKMIKRAVGKAGREWLWSSLQRLTGELSIISESKIKGSQNKYNRYYAGQILGKRGKSEDNLLMIDVNHDFVKLFGGNSFSFIDMESRLMLQGDFAKWLHGFVSTHTGQSTYSAEKLMEISSCSTKSVRHWILRQAKPAFEQLKEQGLIKDYSLKGHLFNWYR